MLIHDVRYALRQLRKSPGFTVASVLSLAIGIGINTAMFSSMNAVVLHPLAVPQLDRVVTVAEQNAHSSYENGYERVALANYEGWTRQSRSFEALAIRSDDAMTLTGSGDVAQVEAAITSANFFSVLRARPLLGRLYSEDECRPGRNLVAVLAYGFWERNFSGDPAILGRTIELDQRTYSIVGVMPKTMQYPSQADVYLPLAPSPPQLADRSTHNYLVTARLRDKVTVRQAQAEMRTLAGHLAEAYPATNTGWSVHVEPLLDGINGPYTPLYYRLILGATLFVLLVVCANIANLQLARGIARRPELAMRTALGAQRSRILRQLVTENLLLSFIGAVGGLGIAELCGHYLLVTMPERVARYMAGWSNTGLNARVLAFSLLLAILSGVIAGVAPALDALRVNLMDQLKAGSRSAILLAVEPMDQVIGASVARQRFTMILLCGFGIVSLVLGAAGLYGVMSYTVARQTKEIGVRMAVGAQRGDVARMVLRRAAWLVLMGLAFGLVAALAGVRLLSGLLFGIAPRDPVTLAVACTILLLTGLFAAWWPARRAASIDPMQALRTE